MLCTFLTASGVFYLLVLAALMVIAGSTKESLAIRSKGANSGSLADQCGVRNYGTCE